MIIDGLLLFTGTSNGGSGGIASGSYTDAPTTGTQVATNILDLGVTSGVPTSANGGGARDIGIGDDPAMKLLVVVTVALVFVAGSGTIGCDLSGAPDSGTGTQGAYTVMYTSPVISQVATAPVPAGTRLADIDVPRPIAGQVLPRYLRLRLITATATWTAGQVEACIVLDRHDLPEQSNATLGGYPVGITVAN